MGYAVASIILAATSVGAMSAFVNLMTGFKEYNKTEKFIATMTGVCLIIICLWAGLSAYHCFIDGALTLSK